MKTLTAEQVFCIFNLIDAQKAELTPVASLEGKDRVEFKVQDQSAEFIKIGPDVLPITYSKGEEYIEAMILTNRGLVFDNVKQLEVCKKVAQMLKETKN